MSRVRPEQRPRRSSTAARTLLLAAGAAWLACAWQAAAQEAGGLRGEVSEDDVNAYLLGQTSANVRKDATGSTQGGAADTQASSDYVPTSPGAVPDEADPNAADNGNTAADQGGSLFSDPDDVDDPFGDTLVPSSHPARPAARQPAGAAADAKAKPVSPTTADAAADDITTGTVREPKIGSPDEALDAGAEREQAIEGLDRRPDPEPFGALGIRAGSFILKPTLETGVTATSNADSSVDGKGALLSQTTLRLNAVSDWSRHSATIDAYGNFEKTISGAEAADPDGGVNARLDLDLADDFRGHATLGLEMAPESATSPVVIVGAASQPLRTSLNGSLGIEKDAGKARFAITGSADRDSYGDADLEMGGTLSQKDRNETLYSLALRGGYQISPAVTPFLETEFGRRIYDEQFDSAGYERSSTRLAARAGVALDMGEKLTGEFSAGWLRESFDDSRLRDLSGPSVAANMVWSPQRGTRIGFFGSTGVEGTTTAGESGSILYSGTLTMDREIRANLTGNATFGAYWRDYSGSSDRDVTLTAETSLTWWLNRYAGLITRVRHEELKSTLPDRDSKTNSVFVGLKFQR